MTRTATKRKTKPRPVVARVRPPRRTSDQAVYGGVIVIGFFSVMIAALFTQVGYWAVLSVAYLTAIVYLIHINVFHVYRGKHLANWQQALAKIPLRFIGYGTKSGKPLEAAHNHSQTLRALMISLVISVVLLAALTLAAWKWTL
jgi:hypothetical protein